MLFNRLFSKGRSWNDLIGEGQAALESGDFQAAEAAFHSALNKATSDASDESTAISLMWLASASMRQQHFDAAEPFLTQALTIWDGIADGRNKHAVQTLHDLACICNARERWDESIQYTSRALGLAAELGWSTDSRTARLLSEQGWALGAKGDYGGAESAARKALAIVEEAGRENDGDAINLILMLMIYCRRQSKRSEVDALLRHLLETIETAGGDLRRFATAVNDKGHDMLSPCKFGTEDVLLNALSIRERVLEPNDRDIAQTLNNLGIAYQTQGRLEEAEGMFTRAIAIYEAALGAENEYSALAHVNLGLVMRDSGRGEDALGQFRHAILAIEGALGMEHELLAPILECSAELVRVAGRAEEAEAHEARARRIRLKAN